ncbi:hypothetical protein IAU59_004583 [Kwoniella sp. CBS 9459]
MIPSTHGRYSQTSQPPSHLVSSGAHVARTGSDIPSGSLGVTFVPACSASGGVPRPTTTTQLPYEGCSSGNLKEGWRYPWAPGGSRPIYDQGATAFETYTGARNVNPATNQQTAFGTITHPGSVDHHGPLSSQFHGSNLPIQPHSMLPQSSCNPAYAGQLEQSGASPRTYRPILPKPPPYSYPSANSTTGLPQRSSESGVQSQHEPYPPYGSAYMYMPHQSQSMSYRNWSGCAPWDVWHQTHPFYDQNGIFAPPVFSSAAGSFPQGSNTAPIDSNARSSRQQANGTDTVEKEGRTKLYDDLRNQHPVGRVNFDAMEVSVPVTQFITSTSARGGQF